MAEVIIRKPDRGGIRIDVQFNDRDDAESIWSYRNRPEWLAPLVTCTSDSRYKVTDDLMWFSMEAAVLAAREFLKPDPLDEPAPA